MYYTGPFLTSFHASFGPPQYYSIKYNFCHLFLYVEMNEMKWKYPTNHRVYLPENILHKEISRIIQNRGAN